MKVLALVLVAACAGDVPSDDYPPRPGESPPGAGGETGPGMLRGRVCLATDLAQPGLCGPGPAGGLNVEIGGSSAVTAADGSFELPPPTGSLLAFTVSGPGAITTTTPFSPATTIPVIDADVWARALASNQITLPPSSGGIIGTVVRDGGPASGIFVESSPAGVAGPFFDAPDSGFSLDATGARGVFFVPGIAFGAANLTMFDIATGNSTTVSGVSVINGGVTILDSIVAP